MNEPLVSIGMPVYNGEKYIRRALDSLLAQDHENMELIISDNASTDSTWEVLQTYACQDRRIILFRQSENIGPIQNFQFVLDQARGEYFLWAAHDDYRDNNYVSTLLKIMNLRRGLEFSCPKVVKIKPDNCVIADQKFPDEANFSITYRSRILMMSAQAAWVYGLFRTASLRFIYPKVTKTGLVWGSDTIINLHYIINQRICGTNDTTIYQMKTGLSAQVYKPKSVWARIRFCAVMISQAFGLLLESDLTLARKLRLAPFVGLYLNAQIFHWQNNRAARFVMGVTRYVYHGLKKRV